MPDQSAEPCAAYRRLEAAAVALGRPLIVPEVVRIIETDPACRAEFEAISGELTGGAAIDDAEIAARVRMPVAFVRSLLLAIRGDAAGERPANVN